MVSPSWKTLWTKHDRAEGRLMRKKIDFRLPAVRRRHGLNALEAAKDTTHRAWERLRLKMVRTKAANLAGIAVKLRHLAWDVPTGASSRSPVSTPPSWTGTTTAREGRRSDRGVREDFCQNRGVRAAKHRRVLAKCRAGEVNYGEGNAKEGEELYASDHILQQMLADLDRLVAG
jgi:hypothetical protein